MEPALIVGEAVADWTGDARYFEYTRAANPVGSGHIPKIPMEHFPAERHRAVRAGIVPFDLSAALGVESGPATSPALLASFVRIAPGEQVATAPVATSELYFVIAGRGTSIVDGRTLAWGAGDFFVLPAGCSTTHRATSDATLYWVTDEPLLRYLGVAPTAPRFSITHFPADAGDGRAGRHRGLGPRHRPQPAGGAAQHRTQRSDPDRHPRAVGHVRQAPGRRRAAPAPPPVRGPRPRGRL